MVYIHSPDEGIDAKHAKKIDDLKFKNGSKLFYFTEKLTDIHFSKHKFDASIKSNKTYVYGAIILALLVLLISAFNYINLSMANLLVRVKEFGVRKTNGASTGGVMVQFFCESLIFWTIGFILAFTLFITLRQSIDDYLGFDTHLNINQLLVITGYCFGGIILFNILINLLPVVAFAKQNVTSISKIGAATVSSKGRLRNLFLTLQFFISVTIIVCTLIVQKQMKFASSINLGYDYTNVMVLNQDGISQNKSLELMEMLRKKTMVKSVASCDRPFLSNAPAMSTFYFETKEEKNLIHTSHITVNPDFFKTLDVKLLQGRFFDNNRVADDGAVIVNETAVKELLKKDALGKFILEDSENPKSFQIIGIVKDFNFRPIHFAVEPLIMFNGKKVRQLYVKINSRHNAEATLAVKEIYKELSIAEQPNFSFMDEALAKNYENDTKAMKLLLFISIVSILISCFGLYAIVYFTINRKVKEIGIRKVNGAKVWQIIAIINRDFLKWVIIAIVVACPVAWYLMKQWLQNFAYRTELSWWIFAFAGILILIITLLTVTMQSFYAATRNPVESLRNE